MDKNNNNFNVVSKLELITIYPLRFIVSVVKTL